MSSEEGDGIRLPDKCQSLRQRSIRKRIETEKNKHLPKPRKQREKPAPLSKYRRKTANARERQRMHEVNQAFDKLKASIPHHKLNQVDDKKDTKITTLRYAISYINSLSDLLDDLNSGKSVSPEFYCTDAELGLENEENATGSSTKKKKSKSQKRKQRGKQKNKKKKAKSKKPGGVSKRRHCSPAQYASKCLSKSIAAAMSEVAARAQQQQQQPEILQVIRKSSVLTADLRGLLPVAIVQGQQNNAMQPLRVLQPPLPQNLLPQVPVSVPSKLIMPRGAISFPSPVSSASPSPPASSVSLSPPLPISMGTLTNPKSVSVADKPNVNNLAILRNISPSLEVSNKSNNNLATLHNISLPLSPEQQRSPNQDGGNGGSSLQLVCTAVPWKDSVDDITDLAPLTGSDCFVGQTGNGGPPSLDICTSLQDFLGNLEPTSEVCAPGFSATAVL